MLNRDVISGIEVINAGGSKTALVVYQPGLSGFPHDISYAFANGLRISWVEGRRLPLAGLQAPSDLSNYSLLVLGFPIYGGQSWERLRFATSAGLAICKELKP